MRSMMAAMALAAGMMAAAAAAAQTQATPPVLPDGTLLDVTAVGRVTRTPDVATIRAGVVTQAPTAAAALADNATKMDKVLAALRRAGAAERDVTTSNVSLQPQYRYAENQPPAITGYQAVNTVSVKFRDVRKSGAVLDALVSAGANQIDGPAMSIDKPDDALDLARNDAVTRARARAELYARAAGLRVDRIVSIDESGENDGGSPHPPVLYRARAMVADAAPTQVLPGETEISATLNVRFLLR